MNDYEDDEDDLVAEILRLEDLICERNSPCSRNVVKYLDMFDELLEPFHKFLFETSLFDITKYYSLDRATVAYMVRFTSYIHWKLDLMKATLEEAYRNYDTSEEALKVAPEPKDLLMLRKALQRMRELRAAEAAEKARDGGVRRQSAKGKRMKAPGEKRSKSGGSSGNIPAARHKRAKKS